MLGYVKAQAQCSLKLGEAPQNLQQYECRQLENYFRETQMQ
jgi:hypothetical protein